MLERALQQGNPEIFNTDQGSQFTSPKFTKPLLDANIKISMDGRGRALDKVFIERFWWTIKHEHIHPSVYEYGIELHRGIEEYIKYYNRVASNINDTVEVRMRSRLTALMGTC